MPFSGAGCLPDSSSAQAEPRTSSRSRVLTDLFEGLLVSPHPAGTCRALQSHMHEYACPHETSSSQQAHLTPARPVRTP